MNFTIGQYYPAHSVIHAIDPRLKIAGLVVYIVALFTAISWVAYLFTALCLCAVIRLSTVPFKLVLKGLRPIVLIIVFTAVLNMFFTGGETVLAQVPILGLAITLEGVTLAVQMAVRLVMLIAGSSMLTLTTSPIQLADAMEYFLKPFQKVGLPAHELAMMMTIALRFIPTLMEEASRIMGAQASRGADFNTGGLVQKAKSLVPLLVPLFVSAFRRADDLAIAMEARCYTGGQGRTKMTEMRLKKFDYLVALIVLIFVSICVIIRMTL